MKISFELSPEEHTQLVDEFEGYIQSNSIETGDELTSVIVNIILTLFNNINETSLKVCMNVVRQALDTSEIYQELLLKYGEENIWEKGIEKTYNKETVTEENALLPEDKFTELWNQAIARKEYLVSTNKYKS